MLRIITALLLGLISSSAQAKEPTNTVTLPSFPYPTMAAIMVIGGKDATICDRALQEPRQPEIPVLDEHRRLNGFLCTGAGRPGATLKFPAGAREVHIEVGTFKMIWTPRPTEDRSEPAFCGKARMYGWDACQTWMNTEFRKQAKAFNRCKQRKGKGKCPSQPPLRMEDCPCRR